MDTGKKQIFGMLSPRDNFYLCDFEGHYFLMSGLDELVKDPRYEETLNKGLKALSIKRQDANDIGSRVNDYYIAIHLGWFRFSIMIESSERDESYITFSGNQKAIFNHKTKFHEWSQSLGLDKHYTNVNDVVGYYIK
jgi:hypothetical protein